MLSFKKSAASCASATVQEHERLQRALFDLPLDFSNITPEIISIYMENIICTTQSTYDYIAQQTRLSFATCVLPLIDLECAAQNAKCIVIDSRHFHPDQSVRDASSVAQLNLRKFMFEQQHRHDVYSVFDRYYQTEHPFEQNLCPEYTLYVSNMRTTYKRNGLHLLDAEQREEMANIQLELLDIGEIIDANKLLNESSYLKFTKEKLAGVPESWFTDRFQVLNDQNEAEYRVCLSEQDVMPILDYAQDRSVREAVFIAYFSICAEENHPFVTRMLLLRNRLASILGYDSYVAYVNELNINKSAERIEVFISDLHDEFKKAHDETLAKMQEFARKYTEDNNFELQQHDMRYIMRAREAMVLNIHPYLINEYFPLDKVMSGTLEFVQELFELEFVQIQNTNKWHSDVVCFNVRQNSKPECLATIHFDLNERGGKQYSFKILPLVCAADASRLCTDFRQRGEPHFLMLGGFAKDSNLSFTQVKEFLHEFGNLLFGVCSNVKIASHNGLAQNIAKELASVPAYFLQNYVYVDSVLEKLSQHVVSGESITPALSSKILALEQMHAGWEKKQQLCLATFDQSIHRFTIKQLVALDFNQCWNIIKNEILQLDADDCLLPARDLNFNGQLFADIYAEVTAACMYHEQFSANPLDPNVGLKFKSCILETAATKSAESIVGDFLGHAPSTHAYMWQALGKVLPRTVLRRLTAEFPL